MYICMLFCTFIGHSIANPLNGENAFDAFKVMKHMEMLLSYDDVGFVMYFVFGHWLRFVLGIETFIWIVMEVPCMGKCIFSLMLRFSILNVLADPMAQLFKLNSLWFVGDARTCVIVSLVDLHG